MVCFNLLGDGLRDAFDPRMRAAMVMNGENILQVKNLEISFNTYGGEVQAVRSVSFDLRRGETLGHRRGVRERQERHGQEHHEAASRGEQHHQGRRGRLRGTESALLSEKQMQEYGTEDRDGLPGPHDLARPDPMRVGRQITESLKKHLGMSGSRAKERAVELLEMVGIPNAEDRVKQYPHQFSGGMRQRVVIAIALACDPRS